MKRSGRRAVLCSSQPWDTEIQVGAHHLARELGRRGWETLFLAAHITPFHVGAAAWDARQRRRARSWLAGRERAPDDGDGKKPTARTPLTLLPLSSVVGLRFEPLLRQWARWTLPSLARQIRSDGMLGADLAIVDTPLYGFMFDWLRPLRKVYRVLDYTPGFSSSTSELACLERQAASVADVVVYTTPALADHARSLGARRVALVPNGVDLAHYRRPTEEEPPEYAAAPRARAVYVGALREWFDYGLVNGLVKALPEVSFVIIGTDHSGGAFRRAPNLHLLGPRPYCALPAYLRHADLGLIPFDRGRHHDLVDRVNPLKLYEYAACGLPVVATSWPALVEVKSPAILCDGLDAWVEGITGALAAAATLGPASRRFADGCDWSARTDQLLAAAELAPDERRPNPSPAGGA